MSHGKINLIWLFALKKGMVFMHDRNKGIILDDGFPWKEVRMYHEMKPRKLWCYEKVKLIKGGKYEFTDNRVR